ncbi:Uncharacterised protein [Bordetella pertussis]|nr:Uncharacterised protein [Bordetella pertussis]
MKLFLTRSRPSISARLPTAKPTRRPASERDLDRVWTTSRLSWRSTSGATDSAPKST